MKPNLSRELRERLKLSATDWARALNINERTVERWEDGSTQPSGLPAEVMRGITQAIAEGADPARCGGLISLGIGALIAGGLVQRCRSTTRARPA